MKVSFVTSFYNNEKDVNKFFNEIVNTSNSLGLDYEIIIIDDGSTDNTLKEIKKLKSNKLKAFKNLVNYGEQKSYSFGIMQASKEYIFIIESDLDIETENISKFINEISKNSEIDMVYAEVNKSFIQKLSLSNLFFAILNKVSNLKFPNNAAWFRIISKRITDQLQDFDENEFHLAGTLNLLSDYKVSIAVNKKKSKSKYSFFGKYLLAINTFINFTSKPLDALLGLGFGFVIINIASLFFLFYYRIQYDLLPGWAGIIFAVLTSFTILLIILGVLSLYISKIYKEVRRVPKIISKKL